MKFYINTYLYIHTHISYICDIYHKKILGKISYVYTIDKGIVYTLCIYTMTCPKHRILIYNFKNCQVCLPSPLLLFFFTQSCQELYSFVWWFKKFKCKAVASLDLSWNQEFGAVHPGSLSLLDADSTFIHKHCKSPGPWLIIQLLTEKMDCINYLSSISQRLVPQEVNKYLMKLSSKGNWLWEISSQANQTNSFLFVVIAWVFVLGVGCSFIGCGM